MHTEEHRGAQRSIEEPREDMVFIKRCKQKILREDIKRYFIGRRRGEQHDPEDWC
jgi:hypothetical protein